MDKQQAAEFLHGQMKPVYGYCLRRCASPQDAEDLAQEILLRAFDALLHREAADPERYLWTIARNTLANHYRERARCTVGVPAEAVDDTDLQSALLAQDEARRLHSAVAQLARQQREIVVRHYFHSMTAADIADELGLPIGTVKWHLFEARKELKHHMTHPREASHLKFDPIRFSAFGTEGSIGPDGSPWRVFRSRLHQNIAYACWRRDLTAPQIADALGVSPVYIEDEVARMADQGYLTEAHGSYRCAILLTEMSNHLTELSDGMYRTAAACIAPALHKALSESKQWSGSGLHTGAESPDSPDHSYTLWALLPWCIASSAPDPSHAFASVATLRPDGARNIVYASIDVSGTQKPAMYEQMENHFSGPCWNEQGGMTLWQLDTCWSEHRIGEVYHHEAMTALGQLRRFFEGSTLSREEYAQMAQHGLLHCEGDPDGLFTARLLPVWISGQAVKNDLLRIAREVYDLHRSTLEAAKAPYTQALLEVTPPHMHPLRRYMLQNVFHSGWFIMHCLNHLIETGRLIPPTEAERRSLHTVLLTD